ncbi:protein-disulfide reductase DsbD [Bosea psychrotolerans]|uniref:Thiol:disulfide interchange protein DsbD n=1 Tax=Bosea psychrotolerans TaxID=1871628 RepID=A0A2S4MCR2_9HYPH|nr:protein-disulfide reductase DsbD [Bosea psychrotolerans]POR52441.1 thiol:disulfide interchange protein DsbD [Bosea psychrotolerans]
MSRPFLAALASLVLYLMTLAGVASAATQRSADEVFRLGVERAADHSLVLTWTALPGHYLYRESLKAQRPDGTRLALVTPAGEQKDDLNFGPTEIYHGQTQALIPAGGAPATGTIIVTYQGCAEQGICYPPIVKSLDLATGAVAKAAPIGVPERSPAAAAPAAAPAGLFSGSLALTLASFLGFGLLLSLTPCIFPMIPILSGMLAQAGGRLSARRGLVLSGVYVLAMALAYAALGVAAALSGRNLQIALQTPLALGLMSLVFVALALSMFGLFDLQLPQSWSTRLAGGKPGRGGSLGGAAMLGFTAALIVGPCVTPPLAAALIYVAQTGDMARGAAALFALGLGMGLPLVLFGTFGARILPRSGPWLVKAKQGFGFVFIGLAIWMLARVLPADVTLALWGLLAIAGGAWFGAYALIRDHLRLLPPLLAVALALYGLVLVGAAATGRQDPLRLAMRLDGAGAVEPESTAAVRVVSTSAAFDAALAEARAASRPILVDFTADWCTICREIDRTVMRDPAIRARLDTITIIRADLTVYGSDGQALMDRFGVVGPPTLLFIDAGSGREVDEARTTGATTVDAFSAMLAKAGA